MVVANVAKHYHATFKQSGSVNPTYTYSLDLYVYTNRNVEQCHLIPSKGVDTSIIVVILFSSVSKLICSQLVEWLRALNKLSFPACSLFILHFMFFFFSISCFLLPPMRLPRQFKSIHLSCPFVFHWYSVSSQHTLTPPIPKSSTFSTYVTPPFNNQLPPPQPPPSHLPPPHLSPPLAGILLVFGPVVRSAATTSCGHWWLPTCYSSLHLPFWSFALIMPPHVTAAPIKPPRRGPCPALAPPTPSVSPFHSAWEETASFPLLLISLGMCKKQDYELFTKY